MVVGAEVVAGVGVCVGVGPGVGVGVGRVEPWEPVSGVGIREGRDLALSVF